MKSLFSILFLIVALVTVASTFKQPPPVSSPTFDPNPRGSQTFPGHGPFNPNPQHPWGKPGQHVHRFRRSNEDKKNHVTIEGQRGRDGSKYNVDYGRTIHESKDGRVILHGGMNKEPQGRPEKHIGVQGQWRF